MCDSAKMEVYLNPVKYCKTPTGHPKGHPCCKIADYDDTALGTGTLTVHPWRAGPDCGKLLLLLLGLLKSRISEKTIEPLLNRPDFKLFHYKARVQPVSKITTIATRNRW